MNSRIQTIILAPVIVLMTMQFVFAAKPHTVTDVVKPIMISESITIDGDLQEAVWKNEPVPATFKTCGPTYGIELDQKTHVWAAYNQHYLYFAFKCFDSEPQRIKTSICKRDNNSRDDWVGVILDAMGNKQTSYEFYVNPSGIQADCLGSAVSGYDMSPDFVWESAGKIVADGYQVEIAIPLQSIRFRSGASVSMGLMFMRNISRRGEMSSWPEMEPGQTQFNFLADATYKDLKEKLNVEILPNFTYSSNHERITPDSWGRFNATNAGVSLKYGITSSIVSEATINPDFSQVESDAFQVETNRRYPVFYSEKRPFFMEGTDIFDLSLVQNGMMLSAVHTRYIIDPSWAVKVSGSAGKASFAVLAANDQMPGKYYDSAINPEAGKDVFWGIARVKMSLGGDNSIGLLYSGRHFAGQKNDVGAVDLQYRFFTNLRLSSSLLFSNNSAPGMDEPSRGTGLNAMLQYSIPAFETWATYERYSSEFAMYSAFLLRSNFSRGSMFVGPNIYIKSKTLPWLQKIQPHVTYSTLHDYYTGLDDKSMAVGINMYFVRQGFLRIRYFDETEGWEGRLFDPNYFYVYGSAQFLKWVYIYGSATFGQQIYYSYSDPFLGNGNKYMVGLILQPNEKLSVNLDYSYGQLRRRELGNLAYKVNIYNVHTSYQFNKYFFVRAAVRYDDLQDKLLTDFLASFTLIPGTVIHLGYGTLHENMEWRDDQWLPGTGSLINTQKSLFFKVSYLWRL